MQRLRDYVHKSLVPISVINTWQVNSAKCKFWWTSVQFKLNSSLGLSMIKSFDMLTKVMFEPILLSNSKITNTNGEEGQKLSEYTSWNLKIVKNQGMKS